MQRLPLPVRRACAVLVACVLSASVGCESATSPSRPHAVPVARGAARYDVILGDTLSCRSGWQIIDGRYVCN